MASSSKTFSRCTLSLSFRHDRVTSCLCEPVLAMQKEGVHEVRPLIGLDQLDETLQQTLLCFVLVAPDAAHSFCSRYDFGPWPLLPGVTNMPPSAWQVLLQSPTVHASSQSNTFAT